MSDGKKVLVTGGCGYIGSHVTRQLSEQGYEVVVYDNLSTGFEDSLLHNETLVKADLNDMKALDETFANNSFHAVLHFAASIVVPESVENPISYYRNNTVNSINLFETCIKHGVKNLVFSSTAAVYGENTLDMVTEQSPTAPANPYAWSKLMDEQILADVANANEGFRFVTLRYFNVAGADPKGRIGQRFPNATHLIKVACETAIGLRESIAVFGDDYPTKDGTCVRDYIHIEDLADAHIKALNYLENEGTCLTLNCGYGQGFSVNDVLDTVDKVNGSSIKRIQAARRPGDVSAIVADSSKLKKTLGWKPQYDDINKIVSSAYEWEKILKNRR